MAMLSAGSAGLLSQSGWSHGSVAVESRRAAPIQVSRAEASPAQVTKIRVVAFDLATNTTYSTVARRFSPGDTILFEVLAYVKGNSEPVQLPDGSTVTFTVREHSKPHVTSIITYNGQYGSGDQFGWLTIGSPKGSGQGSFPVSASVSAEVKLPDSKGRRFIIPAQVTGELLTFNGRYTGHWEGELDVPAADGHPEIFYQANVPLAFRVKGGAIVVKTVDGAGNGDLSADGMCGFSWVWINPLGHFDMSDVKFAGNLVLQPLTGEVIGGGTWSGFINLDGGTYAITGTWSATRPGVATRPVA
ncbi:MAG: hypothetical protein ACHRXM_20050 [Isosphaerales bacterium]